MNKLRLDGYAYQDKLRLGGYAYQDKLRCSYAYYVQPTIVHVGKDVLTIKLRREDVV